MLEARKDRKLSRPTNSHPNDPAWLNRVGAIGLREGRKVEPEDFDQDLSEMEGVEDEGEDSDSSGTLENSSDIDERAEQKEGIDVDDTKDDDVITSERSFEESKTNYSCELKKTREKRKPESSKLQRESQELVDQANVTISEGNGASTTFRSGCENGKAEPLHNALELKNTNLYTGFACILGEPSPGM